MYRHSLAQLLLPKMKLKCAVTWKCNFIRYFGSCLYVSLTFMSKASFTRVACLQGNRAIVVDEPGVTRDRLYGRSYWGDYEFMVVDTGGVLTISKAQEDVMEELAISTTIGMEGIPLASREAAVARMPSMVERQATVAVEESSVIIFLVDGQVWFFYCGKLLLFILLIMVVNLGILSDMIKLCLKFRRTKLSLDILIMIVLVTKSRWKISVGN